LDYKSSVVSLGCSYCFPLAGRKKKRKHSSVAKNRNEAQSAFSLFVHENFELMKKDHADMPTPEIMSILDRQWASTSEEEKQIWRYRAEQSQKEHFPTIPGLLDLEGLPEEETGATKERGSGTDLVTKRISV
jgi:hypothetical protein